METFDLPRRVVAELLGTAILVATVVGSGVMATNLTHDVALQLLGNTLPTGAILDLLDRLPPGPLAKEDGQLLIDSEGRRVG